MAILESLSSGAKRTYKIGRSAVEILNLKTNHNLKGDLGQVDDHKLLQYQGSTRRALASSVTGVVINSALAVACPIFAVGAAINLVQLGVSAANRHRVRREIDERTQDDEKFSQLLKEKDHRWRDIALGCGIKGACIAATCGIVGVDGILDNFTQLAHEGTHHIVQSVATQHVGDAISNSNISGAQHAVMPHHMAEHPNGTGQPGGDHPRVEHFQAHHPHLAKADQGFHKVVAGAGDWINQKLAHVTHLPFQDNWSWATLKSWTHSPVEKLAAVFHLGVVGVANEEATPLLFVDPAVDRGLEFLEDRRRKQEKRAGAHIDGLDKQSGHLKKGDRESQKSKLGNVADEMRRRLAITSTDGE